MPEFAHDEQVPGSIPVTTKNFNRATPIRCLGTRKMIGGKMGVNRRNDTKRIKMRKRKKEKEKINLKRKKDNK